MESDEHSLTVGPDGPILLHDHYLIEQMAQFNRERVPKRQPHAKGSGAFGRFEVTHDVSAYTKAAVFQPGTTTETVIRFSTVAGERGSPDTWRDPRGFALKFYTTGVSALSVTPRDWWAKGFLHDALCAVATQSPALEEEPGRARGEGS